MRISDWSSDVCSSDLRFRHGLESPLASRTDPLFRGFEAATCGRPSGRELGLNFGRWNQVASIGRVYADLHLATKPRVMRGCFRSEEHTSELQSLMRISYAVFCLKKKK